MSSARGRYRCRGRGKHVSLRKPGEICVPEISQNDERPPIPCFEQTINDNVAVESETESLLEFPVPDAQKRDEHLNQYENQNANVDPVLMRGLKNPVFVPKTAPAPQISSSLASAVNAAVFVPGQAFVRHIETMNERLSDIEHFVNNKILQLTEDPGLLDEISMSMANYLSVVISVEDDMVKLSNLLFEKCVSQQNFQYTGSRLANYLDKKLELKKTQQLSFRNVFLKRCQNENSQFQEIIATNPDKACNVAMFLGELLMNYKTIEGETIAKFLTVVSSIIEQLLQCSDRKFLICAGKLLKLTGSSLNQNDCLFIKVAQLAKSPNVDTTAKILFGRVTDLHETSWGQHESLTSPTAHAPQQTAQGALYFQNMDGMLEEQVSDFPVFSEEEWNEYSTETDYSQDEMLVNSDGELSEDFYRILSLEQYGQYVPYATTDDWSNGSTDDYDADYAMFLSEQQQ